MFKKILVATDFSKPSKAALFTAIELGKRCMAELVALHSVTPFELSFGSAQPMALQGPEWRQAVQSQFDDFFPDGLYPDSRKEIVFGRSPAEEILKLARAEQCDLILIGSHGHNVVTRMLLGSVAQRVVRNSEIPVITVRETDQNTRFNRVMVSTDFSDTSLKALHLGVRFADFLRAELTLVHAVEWPDITLLSSVYPGKPVADANKTQPDKKRVEKMLHELLEKERFNGSFTTAVLVGDPADEILLYAKKENVDCIVMGTHGRKGLERVILGSTTATVIGKSTIPVLTISDPS